MSIKKTLLVACIAAAYGYAGCAGAQTTPAAPSLAAVLAATPGLSISGYVASTYTHFDTSISYPSNPSLRAFDVRQNGFALNQAALTVAYLPSSGAGAQVTLIGGSDAKILRNTELPGCSLATFAGCSNSQFDINNGFVQYATGPLTVMAGKFSTLAGAEVLNPANDNEISRSLLFWDIQAGTHTGVRASYAVSPALTLTGGVNNGFNYTTPAPGTSKTIELAASGSPSKMFSYSAAFYSGQSPLFGGSPNGTMQLLDLVGTINATDKLNFAANVDILSKDGALANGDKGKANGLALYANYSLTDQWTLSARGEYIDDKDGIVSGANGTANKLKEMTLAVSYLPATNLKLTGELRQDKSDLSLFTKDGAPTDKQNSIELQAVYSF